MPVTAVKAYLKRIGKTYRFELGIVVAKGTAITEVEREAGSVQFTIVGPKGMVIKGLWGFNPKHLDSTGSKWSFPQVRVDGPKCAPNLCFISATFDKSPTGFYDELREGDQVPLLGFTCNKTKIRQWRNNDEDKLGNADSSGNYDPLSSDKGMKGADFNNSFTIGSPDETYSGNL